jgi:substrate-binding family protein
MRCLWLACLAIPIVLSSGNAHAQISDDVVKVGVLTDLSGPAATATGSGSVAATQMAVDDFGGKVLGKPITVISADHQIKPDVAAGIARQWYDAEQVDLIVDVPVSAVGLPFNKWRTTARSSSSHIRPARPISTANSVRLTRCNGCSTPTRSPSARLRK